MKPSITLTHTLTLKQKISPNKLKSLDILQYSNQELLYFLKSKVQTNPFLSYAQQDIDSDLFLEYASNGESLTSTLMQQALQDNYNLDLQLCEYLISNLNSNGYFDLDYSTLWKQSKASKPKFQQHLKILRTFEPYGVFAFNLSECLKIQCLQSENPHANIAYILCDCLEDVATHNELALCKKTTLTMKQVSDGITFLKTLNPKPAANYTSDALLLQSEFTLRKEEDQLVLCFNDDDLSVALDVEGLASKELDHYRKEAESIMHSVERRKLTLLQIMQSILEVQHSFFMDNKPFTYCTLKVVATMCNLHVSTISRAIFNKSCEFEGKTYPLHSFFVSGGSHDVVGVEIEKRILYHIQQEDKHHPLSDEQLRKLLHKEGIVVARRTIAKYREHLLIYNSQKRKINQTI